MLLWSFLIRLKSGYVLVISLTAIIFTQIFTPSNESADIIYPQVLRILFIPGRTGIIQVFYPLVPWFGVCGLGMFFGKALLKDPLKTFKHAFLLGIMCVVLFVAFRLIGFGDFHPPKDGFTSFMSVTKYPPSTTFLLITLGVNLILLYIFYRFEKFFRNKWDPLLVFGRTALFFYIIHIYLYAVMGYLYPEGSSFGIMYIFWILGLILLYPICIWYGDFKRKKPSDSLWRFF
jgi:uncharacterized membrane protein